MYSVVVYFFAYKSFLILKKAQAQGIKIKSDSISEAITTSAPVRLAMIMAENTASPE